METTHTKVLVGLPKKGSLLQILAFRGPLCNQVNRRQNESMVAEIHMNARTLVLLVGIGAKDEDIDDSCQNHTAERKNVHGKLRTHVKKHFDF